MEPGSYQKLAARTLWNKPARPLTDEETMIIWNAIGLAGEAGEVLDTIKKAIFHQHGLDKEQLVKELGDVLWYVAALCTKLDLNMGDVMHENIVKLTLRYPQGFSTEDSRGRVEYQEGSC